MLERQADLGMTLQHKAAERLKQLPARELIPPDVVAFAKVGVAIERQSRGLDAEGGAGKPSDTRIRVIIEHVGEQTREAIEVEQTRPELTTGEA